MKLHFSSQTNTTYWPWKTKYEKIMFSTRPNERKKKLALFPRNTLCLLPRFDIPISTTYLLICRLKRASFNDIGRVLILAYRGSLHCRNPSSMRTLFSANIIYYTFRTFIYWNYRTVRTRIVGFTLSDEANCITRNGKVMHLQRYSNLVVFIYFLFFQLDPSWIVH